MRRAPFSNREIVGCDAKGAPDTGSRPSSSLWMGSSAKWSASLPSGVTARDAEDPLADQVRERVPNLPRCAFVGQTPGERLDQAVHALGRLEQDGAAVGTRVLLVERGDEGLVEQIRKTEHSVVSCQVSRRGLRRG